MRSVFEHKLGFLTAVLLVALALPAASAKGMDEFTLTKAIPADAFLAVHCRDHAGKEFLNTQMDRVWEAVQAAHFERDIKRMLKGLQKKQLPPGEELVGFDEWWQQMEDLTSGVDWASLGKREFAMGMKLGFPTLEFVILMMPPEDKVASDFEGLCGILKTLVEKNPETLQLVEEEDGPTQIRKLTFVGAPFPLGATIVRHNDVLMLSFGPTMGEQALALLRGGEGESLASTDRFQAAFKKLPPPTDGLTFFDAARMFGQIRGVVDGAFQMAAAGAPAEGEPGYEDFQKIKVLPGKIIDAFDMFEYVAEVKTTDGMRTNSDSIALLRDDAETHAMYPVLFGNKPLAMPLKYVPADAKDFTAMSGVDLHALYKAAVKIVGEDVPDGQEILAQIERLKDTETGPGIDIEKDYISWIGGGFTTFNVPGPTPYSPSEFVVMLSLRDEAKAQEMLGKLFGVLEPMMAQQNGSIVPAEIEGADGFKSVIFPMLAMIGMNKPTLGVKDGWLFFGSSPDMIKSALDVSAGSAANFATNERFLKEGIPAEGAVMSLSFTDLTKLGEDLGKILQMVPMLGMMAGPEVQGDPVIQNLLSMVGRAGRVVRKLDFFQSSATRTVRDGNTLVTKGVMNYREPPPEPTKPTPTTESSGDDLDGSEKPAKDDE